jgi:hypothetical protein
MFLFLLTGLLSVLFLLTSVCFCSVSVPLERLTDTSDVSVLFLFLFKLFLFSFCSISVLGSPVSAVSVYVDGLLGLYKSDSPLRMPRPLQHPGRARTAGELALRLRELHGEGVGAPARGGHAPAREGRAHARGHAAGLAAATARRRHILARVTIEKFTVLVQISQVGPAI